MESRLLGYFTAKLTNCVSPERKKNGEHCNAVAVLDFTLYRQCGGDFYYIPSRDTYLLLGFGEEGVIPATYFSGSQYRNYQRGQVIIPYKPASQIDEGDPHNWRLEGKPCWQLSLDELEKHSVRPALAPFYQQRW